jgi:Ran GTPase-activating protein (RanGAP) involved in mRNA processing and transport
VIATALKGNTSLKSLEIFADRSDGADEPVVLSVAAALSLADALSRHPNLEELSLIDCMFDDFSAIALAIIQSSISSS